MTVGLPDMARRLSDAPTYVVLTTLNPDGSPQSSVVWVRRDGDDLLMSTIRGRLKTRNMERDPRVTVCGYDPGDPFQYVEVRGTVTLVDEGGDALIDELNRKYTGGPWTVRPGEIRVVVRLTPTRVVEHVAAQSPASGRT
ncbi:MAG: PPOX class F420-dependent oxidoreductase [Acidimicrobiales bacterium]